MELRENEKNKQYNALTRLDNVRAFSDILEAVVCAIHFECSELFKLSNEIPTIPRDSVRYVIGHIQAYSSIVEEYRVKMDEELSDVAWYVRSISSNK